MNKTGYILFIIGLLFLLLSIWGMKYSYKLKLNEEKLKSEKLLSEKLILQRKYDETNQLNILLNIKCNELEEQIKDKKFYKKSTERWGK